MRHFNSLYHRLKFDRLKSVRATYIITIGILFFISMSSTNVSHAGNPVLANAPMDTTPQMPPGFSSGNIVGGIAQWLEKMSSCRKICKDRPNGNSQDPGDSVLDSQCGAFKLYEIDMGMDAAAVYIATLVLAACTPVCYTGIDAAEAAACTVFTRISDAFTVGSVIGLSVSAAELQQSLMGEFFGNSAGTAGFGLSMAGLGLDRLTDNSKYEKFANKKNIGGAKTNRGTAKALACVSVALTAASLSATLVDLFGFDMGAIWDTCDAVMQLQAAAGSSPSPSDAPSPTPTDLVTPTSPPDAGPTPTEPPSTPEPTTEPTRTWTPTHTPTYTPTRTPAYTPQPTRTTTPTPTWTPTDSPYPYWTPEQTSAPEWTPTSRLNKPPKFAQALLKFISQFTPIYIQQAYSDSSSSNPLKAMMEQIKHFRSLTSNDSAAETAQMYLNKEKPMPPEFGPLAKIINQMPHTNQIEPLLAQKGLSISEMDSRLRSGESIGDFLSQVPGMPEEAKDKIADHEAGIKNLINEQKSKKTPPPFAAQALSNKPTLPQLTASATAPRTGSKKERSIATTSQTDSTTLEDIPAESTNDIWHSDTQWNIFQVVSKRISNYHPKTLQRLRSR